MTGKHRFVIRVMKLVLLIAQVLRETKELIDVYTDRGYTPGGANAIVDADFDTFYPIDGINVQKMTVSEFNEVASVLVQVLNFLTGQTSVKANH